MPKTKKTEEKKEQPIAVIPFAAAEEDEQPLAAFPFDIEASYTSISGESVPFKARKFVPISRIAITVEGLADAVISDGEYRPYLEEHLVWTSLVGLYTNLEINELIDQDVDVWHEELDCSDLKKVLLGIIMPSQYKLIVESTHKLIDYKKRKTSMDVLIETLMADESFTNFLEAISVPDKLTNMEGNIADGNLS